MTLSQKKRQRLVTSFETIHQSWIIFDCARYNGGTFVRASVILTQDRAEITKVIQRFFQFVNAKQFLTNHEHSHTSFSSVLGQNDT